MSNRYILKEQERGVKVQGHSAIVYLDLNSWDENAGDAWANIRDLRTSCKIGLKDEKEQRIYSCKGKSVEVNFDYKGEHVRENVCVGNGLYRVLHQLELPSVRKEIERVDRIKEIDEIRKKLSKERRTLTKSK